MFSVFTPDIIMNSSRIILIGVLFQFENFFI